MVAIEERRRRFILLLGLYMFFIHAYKACCEHSGINTSLAFFVSHVFFENGVMFLLA